MNKNILKAGTNTLTFLVMTDYLQQPSLFPTTLSSNMVLPTCLK